MKVSSDTICIIDSSIKQTTLEKIVVNSHIQIVAADYEIDKKLDQLNVKHLRLDDYLDKNERLELYEFTLTKYNWFEKIKKYKKFEIGDDVNILSFMSPLEFHEFLLSNLIKLYSIKNLVSHFEPCKILITKSLSKFTTCLSSNFLTEIIDNYDNNEKKSKGFLTDQIELKFNIFSRPITFYVSKKWYAKLKNFYENFICKRYNLWFTNYEKDIVLFLEFNTSLYKDLIQNLTNSGKTVVLLNRRRSAIWGDNSVNILKQNNGTILNTDKFFDFESEKEFNTKKKILRDLFDELWISDELEKIFSKDKISFWPIIKQRLKTIFINRLDDYVKFHIITKNILKTLNIKSILCLNESGETENIIIQNNRDNIPVFLLQHAFLRYDKKNFDLQWIYEDQRMLGLKSSNLLLWGNNDYKFFSTCSNLEPNKLIVTGSPRHDQIKNSGVIHRKNSKSVLITLSPISDRSGNVTINLIERYEKKLEEIIKFLQTYDIEIIIKLHPGENWHNQLLLDYLKIFKNITIYQTKPPYELIEMADFMITFTPELYDSSTIILDALVLNTPVLQLILDSQNTRFENKHTPILRFTENDDINKTISKCLGNNEFLLDLIKEIPDKTQDYLSYQNNSCENISRIIHEKSLTDTK